MQKGLNTHSAIPSNLFFFNSDQVQKTMFFQDFSVKNMANTQVYSRVIIFYNSYAFFHAQVFHMAIKVYPKVRETNSSSKIKYL